MADFKIKGIYGNWYDDLSDKTYQAILAEAGKFDDHLTLRFGLLSYKCNDEKDFIDKSVILIQKMLRYDEQEMDDLFFLWTSNQKIVS